MLRYFYRKKGKREQKNLYPARYPLSPIPRFARKVAQKDATNTRLRQIFIFFLLFWEKSEKIFNSNRFFFQNSLLSPLFCAFR